MTRLHQAMFAVGALVAVCALAIKPSEAKPIFAQKEGKPCQFCHTNPPMRNYRGIYYKAHNLTFEGFDDAAEAKKAGVDIAPDPDPTVKPKSWTPPKTEAPKETPKEEPKPAEPAPKKMTVAEAKAKAGVAEKAYNANKKDATLKKNYAASLADLAEVVMLDESTPPNKRYPSSLKLFRQALKLDPTNQKAKDNIKLIEDVYKKMGKEVPK